MSWLWSIEIIVNNFGINAHWHPIQFVEIAESKDLKVDEVQLINIPDFLSFLEWAA